MAVLVRSGGAVAVPVVCLIAGVVVALLLPVAVAVVTTAAAVITAAAVTAASPAPGQGCLALEARVEDDRAAAIGTALTHQPSLECLTAERALVAELDASCRTPVAAHAVRAEGRLVLSAFVGLPDGGHWIRDALDRDAADPAELGRALAARLVSAGAVEVLQAAETA